MQRITSLCQTFYQKIKIRFSTFTAAPVPLSIQIKFKQWKYKKKEKGIYSAVYYKRNGTNEIKESSVKTDDEKMEN